MATNRIDSLDPALIRPGRIDRKIEFPLPDEKTKRRIFNIHTSRMQLADDVNMDEFITAKDELSGADIKVIFWKLEDYLSFLGDVYGSRPVGAQRTSNACHNGGLPQIEGECLVPQEGCRTGDSISLIMYKICDYMF